MTLFHVQFDLVQRSRGNNAVKVAAYNATAAFVDNNGTEFDFKRKRAEHQGHAVLLPAGAPIWASDAAELWRRAEAAERRGDAQPARLIEFSIPRDVPPERRMEFARALVQPLVDEGMAAQVDIHCVTAADGDEQPHAHVILSMRKFDGDTFAKTKERAWNQQFQAEKGRTMRAAVAERMNEWLAANEIDVTVDHRRAVERGDDAPPERNVSRRIVEAYKKAPGSDAAAPFRATLEARGDRKEYRRARHAARAASTEARRLDAVIDGIEQATPGARMPGRRRGTPPQTWSADWTPPTDSTIFASCEIGRRSAMLSLAGGGAVIDKGDRLTVKGRVSDEMFAAVADQAVRHGWAEVELTGDAAFRDRLAAAMQAQGIKTINHGPASAQARRQAERALAAQRAATAPAAAPKASAPPATRPVARQPVPAQPEPEQTAERSYSPAYRPSWATGPRKGKQGAK